MVAMKSGAAQNPSEAAKAPRATPWTPLGQIYYFGLNEDVKI